LRGNLADDLAITARGYLRLKEIRKLDFLSLTPNLIQPCSDFNERLRQAGFDGRFACRANCDREDGPPAPKEEERFVAVDFEGHVRGAYALRWQTLWLRGEELRGASYGYPVSEGIVDKRYTLVGVLVLRDAIKRCEYLYALGAGGRFGNVFRVAQHAGWELEDVPFLFRVLRGGRFLRKLPQMQHGVERRLLATFGDLTGLVEIASGLLHAGTALRHGGNSSLRQPSDVTVEEVKSLADAANEVWVRARTQYAFCVVRDGAHVEASFPTDRADLHRLVIRRQGAIIGWSVVMTESLSRLRNYLGDVTPGLIVDAFGDTSHALHIARAATAYLAARGVDVVITNTSHCGWLSAYERLGFIRWRSQFPLIVSRSLARRLGDLRAILPQSHMSRSDGDGVYYLS
jgi:hypothetical protein